MTELRDVQLGGISTDTLIPKVTKAIAGKLVGRFIVGLFYQRNNLLYCYSAPGNEQEEKWCNTPIEAIEKWKIGNPGDSREII